MEKSSNQKSLNGEISSNFSANEIRRFINEKKSE